MERQLLFNRFKEDVEKNIQFAVQNFSHLSEPQFNWHPATKVWSIGQCFQHINMITTHWLKQLDKVLKAGIKSDNSEDYTSGFLGNYLLKLITPVAIKKFITPKLFEPHFLVYGKVTMNEFIDFQHRFSDIAEKIKDYDLKKNKLDSTVLSFLQIRLGDAFTINNQHTRRHLNQALNVKNREDFPKE